MPFETGSAAEHRRNHLDHAGNDDVRIVDGNPPRGQILESLGFAKQMLAGIHEPHGCEIGAAVHELTLDEGSLGSFCVGGMTAGGQLAQIRADRFLVERPGKRHGPGIPFVVSILAIPELVHAVLDGQRIDRIQNVPVTQVRVAQPEQGCPDDLLARRLRATLGNKLKQRLVGETFPGAVHQRLVDLSLFSH